MRERRRRLVGDRAARSVVGAGRDGDVLASLAWAHILTTRQVQGLHFPSRRVAQRRLRALLDHGLVRAKLQGDHLHRDNVYVLSAKGAARVEEDGRFLGPVRPGAFPRPQKLSHALAIREAFVACRLLAGTTGVDLLDFRFDQDLAGEPVLQAAELVPDAIAHWRVAGRERYVALEVDLGSEPRRVIERKLVCWRRLVASGGLSTATGGPHVLYLAAGGRRCTAFRQLLAQAGLEQGASVALLEEAGAAVAAAIGVAPYIQTVRTVRIGTGSEVPKITELLDPDLGAFRPLGVTFVGRGRVTF